MQLTDEQLASITWHRAKSATGKESAVEVARWDDLILIRQPGQTDVGSYTLAEWRAFKRGAELGDFDDI